MKNSESSKSVKCVVSLTKKHYTENMNGYYASGLAT